MINNKEYAKIVGRNLRRIMYDREVSQAQLANDLKLTKSTVSSWMNGYRTPRMDKIDMLCNYLHCKRSDLMEPHSAEYRYVQNDTDRIAKIIRDNPTMHNLFDIARNCTPDNLELIAEVLKRMKQ